MSNGSNQPRPTRNERREAAREKARLLREAQRKREKRNKVLIQGGVVVAVLAVAALVGGLIFNSIQPEGPGPKNMASDGILLTSAGAAVAEGDEAAAEGEAGAETEADAEAEGAGIVAVSTPAIDAGGTPTPTVQDDSGSVANIVTYVDYLCPYCGLFDRTNAEAIRTLVETGAATYEVHPIAMLTNKSAGTQYSLRAANAAACVADTSPDQFLDFHDLLFVNQPEELSTGLTNDELVQLAEQAGVSSPSTIASCIDEKSFTAWANDATARALNEPVPNSDLPRITGTPTVLVNGQLYSGALDDTAEFQSFVQQAVGTAYTESTATPTPSPTPDPES